MRSKNGFKVKIKDRILTFDTEDDYLMVCCLGRERKRTNPTGIYVDSGGYARVKRGRNSIKLHHMFAGQPLPGYVIDHINRDKLDNRRANLRVVTKRQNNMNNARQLPRWVGLEKDGKFYTRIRIGPFEDPKEAYKIAHAIMGKYFVDIDIVGQSDGLDANGELLSIDQKNEIIMDTLRSNYCWQS